MLMRRLTMGMRCASWCGRRCSRRRTDRAPLETDFNRLADGAPASWSSSGRWLPAVLFPSPAAARGAAGAGSRVMNRHRQPGVDPDWLVAYARRDMNNRAIVMLMLALAILAAPLAAEAQHPAKVVRVGVLGGP